MNSKKIGVYILISVLIVTMAIGLFACSGVNLSTKHTIIFNVQYGDELSVTSIKIIIENWLQYILIKKIIIFLKQ